MNKHMIILLPFLALLSFSFTGCGGSEPADRRQAAPAETTRTETTALQIPEFNADSAWAFVNRQVAFGPRVPNTRAHRECGDWLQQSLERFADTVYVQATRVRAYDGTILNIRNFIGSFQPEKNNRILLCAHWDTRPWADHDPNPDNHFQPFDGANDGASGVGVLLEIARLLNKQQPHLGIDIIFFDAEDYGEHEQSRRYERDTWALGSQHWSKSPHRPDYYARFGILLDMVGAHGATFRKEGYSMLYAPNVVRKVWAIARDAGFSHFFINEEGGHIMDDHYYVNEVRNIPTINIIDQRRDTPHGFFEHWHTMQDNMDAIDKNTLYAVGTTVTRVIYSER